MNWILLRKWIGLAILAGLVLEFLRIIYVYHAAGMPLAGPLGSLFLSLGMLCWYLRGFVSRDSLRRSLYVMSWVLSACSFAAMLWVDLAR
jgi:hypothetical protein